MIAYFILVHRYPSLFKRMFTAIYDPENVYAVHVDNRSSVEIKKEVEHFLRRFSNVVVIQSKNALWGGYSLVDAELRGMAALLHLNKDWKYFVNLSGQDFPLKSQRQIKAYLHERQGCDFLKVVDQRKVRPATVSRFENYVMEFANRIVRTPLKRRFLKGVTPYIGNQWMTVTRKFCEFVCESPEVLRFKKFYRHTFIADESFFQTVIMNTSYRATIVNDDLRAIDWVPDGIIKLRPRTFTFADKRYLLSSKQLFARKFDETVDEKILAALEARLT